MQRSGHKIESVSFKLIKDGDFFDNGDLKIKSVYTAHMENKVKYGANYIKVKYFLKKIKI